MKDTFTASVEDRLAASNGDLMVPAQGSVTRTRRFATPDAEKIAEAELVMDTHTPPARYSENAGLPATAPRDL